MIVVGIVIVAALCSGFSALIAQGKGRDPGGFAVAGLLLGVIGLLIAAFAADAATLEKRRPQTLRDQRGPSHMDRDGL
jgi:hypothetical protein